MPTIMIPIKDKKEEYLKLVEDEEKKILEKQHADPEFRGCPHGEKDWAGADANCAFGEDGFFKHDNWNCFLMNKVRSLCSQWDDSGPGINMWHDDSYIGVIPIRDDACESPLSGRFAVLTWYKSRGKTDGFWITDGYEMRVGHEGDAEEILRLHSLATKVKNDA